MNFLIGVIIVFSALVILSHGMLRISDRAQKNQIALAYMETLKSYYLSIQNQIEATRKFRHDLAKHIQTLLTLFEYLFHAEPDQIVSQNTILNPKDSDPQKNLSLKISQFLNQQVILFTVSQRELKEPDRTFRKNLKKLLKKNNGSMETQKTNGHLEIAVTFECGD